MNGLSRRGVLFALPAALAVASCASEPEAPEAGNFAPLDFSYLLPLRLNVADVAVEQHYYPLGVPPDVTPLDPIQPVAALRQMAEQRLRAEGSSGRAVFAIDDASLLRQGDLITGTMSVELTILGPSGARQGFARATVIRQLVGARGNISAALYRFTREMMDQMNIEFEYQVRHALGAWLLPEGNVPAPVRAEPLAPGGAPVGAPGAIPAPPLGAGAPVPLGVPPSS